MQTRYEEYYQALGARLGIDIEPNEDGACLINVEESFGVIMRGNEAARRMELSAVVADDLPESVEYSDMLDILSMSLGPFFDAPGLGREPESGSIVMYALFPFDTTSPADFADATPQFIDRASALMQHFAAIAARK